MKLEELIKTLEGAQKKATEGKASCTYSHDRSEAMVSVVREDGAEIIIVSRANPDESQAIADRHNTADLTLHYLKVLVATEQRVVDSMRSIERWRTRAESAEAEVERLKASKGDPTP